MAETSPEHSIVLIRNIKAPIARIYAAWTEPQAMSRWLGHVIADVRVGGKYRFESPAPGGKTFIYTGEYLQLEPNARIAQSFLAGEPDPDTPNPYTNEFVEVRLDQTGSFATSLTFINGWDGKAVTEEERSATEVSWTEWLDRMEDSLEPSAL